MIRKAEGNNKETGTASEQVKSPHERKVESLLRELVEEVAETNKLIKRLILRFTIFVLVFFALPVGIAIVGFIIVSLLFYGQAT
jgi:hypothetical protein